MIRGLQASGSACCFTGNTDNQVNVSQKLKSGEPRSRVSDLGVSPKPHQTCLAVQVRDTIERRSGLFLLISDRFIQDPRA